MIEIVINVIECLMLTYFLFSLMDIKENKKILYFISLFITSMTIITISNYISMYDIFLTSVIIVSNILVSYLFVNNDFSEIVFYACLETLVSAFSVALATSLSEMSQNALVIRSVLYFTISLIMIYIVKRCIRVSKKRFYYFLSIVVIALGLFVSNILHIITYYIEKGYFHLFIILLILSLLLILVFITYLYNSKYEIKELKDLQENNNIITNLYNEVKITKHDVKHVYEMFSYYLNNKEYDKLSEYVNTKQEEITNIPTLIQSKHELLNMILNNKIVKAYSNNIQVECEIAVLDYIFIKDYELNELLSNALDNAVENNIENGYIRIKIIQENNYMYILIINSTNNKDIKTKKNQNNHGYGLKSIKKICNKYNGDIEVSFEKKEFQLKMTLIA